VFIAFTSLVIYSFKKNRRLFFWLSFFFISIMPMLNPFGVSWLVAERYVYLASVGIFTAIAVGVDYLMQQEKLKRVVEVVFILIIIALSIRTIIRNIDWKNQDNLWIATAKTSPSSPNNYNNLGDMYARHGNYEMAIQAFKTGLEISPNYGDVHHNLANVYVHVSDYESAIFHYEKAVSLNPKLWQSHIGLANIYFSHQEYAPTVHHLLEAASINPGLPTLYSSLGISYAAMGENEKAAEAFKTALKLNPEDQFSRSELVRLGY
jgi:protein O-mannosyl-transferase